jgi:hypothetical protein
MASRSGGGVGLLADDDIVARREEGTNSEGLLWSVFIVGGSSWYIGVVYMQPGEGAEVAGRNSKLLEELEEGIVRYRQRGYVVVMGDMNARIGKIENVMNGRLVQRDSEDSTVSARGRKLMRMMKRCGMVVANGHRERAVKTCRQWWTQGGSVIDLICIDERMADRIVRCTVSEKDIGSDHYLVKCVLEWTGCVSDEPRDEIRDERKKTEKVKKVIRLKEDDWRKIGVRSDEQLKKWKVRVEKTLNDENEIREEEIESIWDEWRKIVEKQRDVLIAERGESERQAERKRRFGCRWSDRIFRLWIRKQQIQRLMRKEKSEEQRARLQKKFIELHKEMKLSARKKRRRQRLKLMREIEELKDRDPREFWIKLKRLSNLNGEKKRLPEVMKDDEGSRVEDIEKLWKDEYEALGRDVNDDGYDEKFKEEMERRVSLIDEEDDESRLNERITRAEVERAVKDVKNGKAVGFDGIQGEMIKYGGSCMIDSVWRMCEIMWRSEGVPDDWSRGVIVPVWKAGDRTNVANYRGITLLSVVGKMYAIVLNTRLREWSEERGVICEEQGGFRRGRGCRDQLLSLVEIVRMKKRGGLFCAFLDVKKAYDRVFRDGLWERVREEGVRGKMWRVLKCMYRNVQSAVRVNDVMTGWFDVNVGLRQGCVLSPVLFNIFINGLVKELNRYGYGVVRGRDINVSCLLYADDIVLFSDSRIGLQELLDVAYEYGRKWRFSFGVKKSKVVVFGKREKGEDEVWRLGDSAIERVDMYRYLGAKIGIGLGWRMAKEERVDRARQAAVRACSMGLWEGGLSVRVGINIYKTLVRPAMEYGIEVMDRCVWEEAEKVQTFFGRAVLGVQMRTAGEVIRGELGWWSLAGRRDYLRLKYWGRLIGYDDSRLVKKIYRYRKIDDVGRRGWCTQTRDLMYEIGLEQYWDDEDEVTKISIERWDKIVFEKIQKSEEKRWSDSMKKKSKLRRYREIKTCLRLEQYVIDDSWKNGRLMMTRLRSGTNELEIESGRWIGKKIEDRVCRICNSGSVEDEPHMIDVCSMYNGRRSRVWRDIEYSTHGRVKRCKDGSDWKSILLSDVVQSRGAELDRRSIVPIVKQYCHWLAVIRKDMSSV